MNAWFFFSHNTTCFEIWCHMCYNTNLFDYC
jgi:hypothetical protein